MAVFNYIQLLALLLGFVFSFILTLIVKILATKLGVIDRPTEERKIHQRPTPLLGGLAIFVSVSVVIYIFRYFNLANFSEITDKILLGVLLAGIIIMIGGLLDDKYNLKPARQFIWPVLAVVTVILFGLKITYITNPLGGPGNAIIYLTPAVSIVITFLWLIGMMYTTKFLDGLDGLLAGISAIAAIIIFFLSLSWDVVMSATGVWALALVGSVLAFLVFNWHPAKIFLGEGGSIWLGFMLAVLSIISGSKIATTLLVMGIPALDVVWVFLRRVIKHKSPFKGDKSHLHFQLLNLGFRVESAVLFLYFVALGFGAVAIISGGLGKLIGLVFLIVVMIILGYITYKKSEKTVASKN